MHQNPKTLETIAQSLLTAAHMEMMPRGDRQENKELSCLNSRASEAYEETNRIKDPSMKLDNITMSRTFENSTLIDPVSEDSIEVVREQLWKSENSTRESLDDDNFSPEINRSTNIANDLLELEHNADGGTRPNDIVAQHEVNNYSAASQTAGNTSNIKTAVGSNTYANRTTTYSKLQSGANSDKIKAMDQKNKTSTDHEKDNADSSCHGRNIKKGKRKAFNSTSPNDNSSTGLQQDNNDTKVIKLDDHITRSYTSQDQTKAITKSPNALAPTSPTYFQQDVEVTNLDDPVSLPCGAEIPSPCESKTYTRNYSGISSMLYKRIGILLMTVLLVAAETMQAPPVPVSGEPYQLNTRKVSIPNQTLNIRNMVTTDISSPQWHLYHFNTTNRDVIHQLLTIKNMENRDSAGCTFNFTALPFWYNCSQSGYLIFAYNETHIEMVTKDLSTNDYNMEYGNGLNGHNLPATSGERLDDQSIEDKIAGITKPTDSTPRAQAPEDTDHTVWIALGVGVGVLATFIALVSLYIFCQTFHRWVQSSVSSCRRRNTNNVPEANAGHSLEMKPFASPTTN